MLQDVFNQSTNFVQQENLPGFFQIHSVLTQKHSPTVTLMDGREVINLLTNNYLGLSGNTKLLKIAADTFDQYSFGWSLKTTENKLQTMIRELEINLSEFLQVEDTILFSAYAEIQTQLFSLMGVDDVIICDELNTFSSHLTYKNNDLADLEKKLRLTKKARYRLIIVSGVSALDGKITNLPIICELAKKYNALLLVDDTHGVGFMGSHGYGTHEYHRVMNKVDLLMGSFLEKSSNYIGGNRSMIQWLRTHLVKPAPTRIGMLRLMLSINELLNINEKRIQKLHENELYLRQSLKALGLTLLPTKHPIISVMTKNADLTEKTVYFLLQEGVYTVGISAPIVPENKSRVRMQISAAHERWQLDKVVDAYVLVAKKLKLI